MKKPLVFEAPPRSPTADTMSIRLDAEVIADVSEIARKCRLSARHVASECIRYALQNVVIREAKLYELTFSTEDE